MHFLRFTFLFLLCALVDSHSPLTEKKSENGLKVKSLCETSETTIDNLQNQITQETVIRLSLLKHVYSLVNDMISLKNEMAVMKNDAEKIRKSTDDLRHEDKKMLNEIEQMKHDQNDTTERIMNVQHEHINKMLSEIEQHMTINHNDTSERIVNVQHEYKTKLNEIEERMKYNHNDTSEKIVNMQHEYKTKLSEIEQRMKINYNDTTERIVNVQHEYKTMLSEIEERINYNYKATSERIVNVQNDLVNVNNSVGFLCNYTDKIDAKNGIQDCLESSHCWLLYNFKFDDSWNGCEGGSQYVKKTNYSSAPYLGVMTCNSTRYKLFLSKTVTGTYYNIADTGGNGQDHCELLGTAQDGVLPRDYERSPNTQGFYRNKRGGTFSYGTIGYRPQRTNRWYEKWIECGVSIPGSDRVIPM